jgi:hypothetical protein
MRRLPFFTAPALAAAGLTAAVIAAAWWATGGRIASPGALGAAHADLAGDCAACHPAPWSGATASTRCLECHDDVRAELARKDGLHAHLGEVRDCLACHTDHRGAGAELTRLDPDTFPHDATGFSLTAHRETRAGRAFACADCHGDDVTRWDEKRCESCHRDEEPAFTTAHVADWGHDCRACHDGVDRFGEGFDHGRTSFALDGKHTGVACVDCHQGARAARAFGEAPETCVGCHPMPDDHKDTFGDECAACHDTTSWQGATLKDHRFPLDHGARRASPCKTCHPGGYKTYTCYGCHEHTPANIEREHREEGIRDFRDCVRCHPTGREDEAEEHGGHGEDDDDD